MWKKFYTQKIIWATHITYTFIIRIKYFNYKLQNCKLQYVKKKVILIAT